MIFYGVLLIIVAIVCWGLGQLASVPSFVIVLGQVLGAIGVVLLILGIVMLVVPGIQFAPAHSSMGIL